eukprot:3915805-Pyramimonas_sp.AAC.1
MDGLDDLQAVPQQLSDDDLAAAAGSQSGNDTDGLTVGQFKQILRDQLQPIQNDIRAIKQHGVSQQDLRNAVEPLKTAVDDITARVAVLESLPHRPDADSATGSARSLASTVEAKLSEIERQMAELTTNKQYECNAVIGGLGNFDTLRDASAWINEQALHFGAPEPKETFIKGDAFQQIFFAKFDTASARDTF